MSRIAALDPEKTAGQTHATLAAVGKMLGVIPNLFRVAAQAPSALEGLVALNGATAHGTLRGGVRAAIALVVAETNGCDYCLSAHTVLGKMAGLDGDAMGQARRATASDPRTQAILGFARQLVLERGRVGEGAIAELQAAGVTDAETLEIIANVVLNIFTNYINLVAGTDIDFPVVRALAREHVAREHVARRGVSTSRAGA